VQTDPATLAGSKAQLWTGRVLSGLVGAFMLLDAVMKIAKPEFIVKATIDMGFSEAVILPLGVVLLTSTVLYLIPRTTILGAILLTGYLGGAVETHVFHRDGWFEILFPTFFGAFVWGGLCLRDPRLRALIFQRT
jgi:DoxX-like family